MVDEPKEIMSQEEIDAYIASVRTSEEKEQQQAPQQQTQQQEATPEPVNEKPASEIAAGEPKEIMSQEEIDAYIASVKAKEEKEPQAKPESNAPKDPLKTSEAVSQGDIDDLVSQQQSETPDLRKDSGAVSQNDIDALIAQEQDEVPAEAEASGEVSQGDIDALLAQDQGQEQEEAPAEAEASGEVSQGDIDALLAQDQGQEQKKAPAEAEASSDVSQGDIDALLAQEEGQEQEETSAEPEASGDVSQGDIDALLAQEQEQGQEETPAEAEASGEVSQGDIDALLAQEQEQEETPAEAEASGEVSQGNIDALLAQEQGQEQIQDGPKPNLTGDENDSWEDLGSEIISQDEINALLSGLSEPEDSPASDLDAVITEQEKEFPISVNDIAVNPREEHFERQKKKEERIIQKKTRASAMIRELLKMEEKRIHFVQARKTKMINEDLYTRYEITRADRSKITVSMSDKTAAQYHSSHPGCDMYRI